MLAIGRALMTTPHLLILDDATEALRGLCAQRSGVALANSNKVGCRCW
jgi:ABC-type branched-subunit amino acid transport system ATPase component